MCVASDLIVVLIVQFYVGASLSIHSCFFVRMLHVVGGRVGS